VGGKREDGDGGRDFWVKSLMEVARYGGCCVTGVKRLGQQWVEGRWRWSMEGGFLGEQLSGGKMKSGFDISCFFGLNFDFFFLKKKK
jgi:hypothetical protein